MHSLATRFILLSRYAGKWPHSQASLMASATNARNAIDTLPCRHGVDAVAPSHALGLILNRYLQ